MTGAARFGIAPSRRQSPASVAARGVPSTAIIRVSVVDLTADPLAGIGNTRRIETVWAGGRIVDRRKRQELLAAAEAAAR